MALVLAIEMLGGLAREWLPPASTPVGSHATESELISDILWTGGLRLVQLVAVLIYMVFARLGPGVLNIEPASWKQGLKWGCGASVALAVVTSLIEAGYHLVGGSFLKTEVLGGGTPSFSRASSALLYLLIACLIGPIAEEVFFRGLLQQFLRGVAGRVASVLLSAAIFAAAHAFAAGGFNPITHITGGLLFALLFERAKSLLAPVIVHVAGNSAIMLLAFFWVER